MAPIAGPLGLALNPRWIECSTERDGSVLHRYVTQQLVGFQAASEELLRLAGRQPVAFAPSPDSDAGEHLWTLPEETLSGTSPLVQLLEATRRAAQSPAPRPRIMGILNVTPDSFSDGGAYLDPGRALDQAHAMASEGAHLIDIGGESTRPGSAPVDTEEEWRRVGPVLDRLQGRFHLPISIDTTKAEIARRAVAAGASWVNDVRAGTQDSAMLKVVAQTGATYVAMHCAKDPAHMQLGVRYRDVVSEVTLWLRERLAAMERAGIEPTRILLDPGIGFGKLLAHNLALLGRLGELRSLGCPLLLGVSRKSFIAHLSEVDEGAGIVQPAPEQRLGGTAAAVGACVAQGASVLRVHDVATMAQAAQVAYAILHPPSSRT